MLGTTVKQYRMKISFCFEAIEFQRHFLRKPSKVRKLVRTNQIIAGPGKHGDGGDELELSEHLLLVFGPVPSREMPSCCPCNTREGGLRCKNCICKKSGRACTSCAPSRLDPPSCQIAPSPFGPRPPSLVPFRNLFLQLPPRARHHPLPLRDQHPHRQEGRKTGARTTRQTSSSRQPLHSGRVHVQRVPVPTAAVGLRKYSSQEQQERPNHPIGRMGLSTTTPAATASSKQNFRMPSVLLWSTAKEDPTPR